MLLIFGFIEYGYVDLLVVFVVYKWVVIGFMDCGVMVDIFYLYLFM